MLTAHGKHLFLLDQRTTESWVIDFKSHIGKHENGAEQRTAKKQEVEVRVRERDQQRQLEESQSATHAAGNGKLIVYRSTCTFISMNLDGGFI